MSKKILAVHTYQKAVGHTCMEAPEEDVRKSGDCRRGGGSNLALVVLSKDARQYTPSSDVQLLAAPLRHCHVSAITTAAVLSVKTDSGKAPEAGAWGKVAKSVMPEFRFINCAHHLETLRLRGPRMLLSETRSPWEDLEALSWASCTGMSISAVDAGEYTANQRHRQEDKRNTNAARFQQDVIRFTLPEGALCTACSVTSSWAPP